MGVSGKLTNLQLELLKMFQYELSENQLIEIKMLLSNYFAKKASDEIDKLWDAKGWNNHTMEEWLNANLKSPNE